MEGQRFQQFASLLELCRKISENPSEIAFLQQLRIFVNDSSKSFVRASQKKFIMSVFPYIQKLSKDKECFSSSHKQLLIETLSQLFEKLPIENVNVFFNFYTFLLLEMYDYSEHKVYSVSEEYKLAFLQCATSLFNAVSPELVDQLYVKENVPKFAQIIYVCTELLKKESARNIRLSSINCTMAVARVLNESDLFDPVLRAECANTFMFFLPGLSKTLSEVAVEDLKVGHIIPMVSIRALGRIISMVTQDYNPADQKLDTLAIKSNNPLLQNKLRDMKEVNSYLENTSRNIQWYKTTDEKLNITLKKMAKLTYHSHTKVRAEMADLATDIVQNCATTMPQTVSTLLEHLIVLSQDSEQDISNKSKKAIEEFSKRLSADNLKFVFENLEEGFYNTVSALPRIFNSIDDQEKAAALNLLSGYIELFGNHNLTDVLLSANMLNNLLQNLLHVSELERSRISLLEEYSLTDLSMDIPFLCPWANFRFFKDENVKIKLNFLCEQLAKTDSFELIHNSLVDTFLYDTAHRKEAVYLINAHISGLNDCNPHMHQLKKILNIYSEPDLNDLNIILDSEEYSLDQIQENVITVCLATEGIGKVALVLKRQFHVFLLKTLYLVLEKAGCNNPLIKASGLMALKNLTEACNYKDITDLINGNFDFISFHVRRKLTKIEDKEGVLNVLSVILQYCNVEVLIPMKNIIEDVLLLSCDKFKQKQATSFLKVFKMFVLSIKRWFRFESEREEIKSRKLKQMDVEHFKVSGIEFNNDFSDDVLNGKSAEEMYREDMETKEKEKEEIVDEDKKPPPMHIQLVSLVLKRSLHFLSSKDKSRKILVLEILTNGVEILKEWQDELLPIVHQIWSPLVQRFKENHDPLIVRLSFKLLDVLARLSKDFIRLRVIKEVLPKLQAILEENAKCSYLKDKGAAYRYSQNYKLQSELLSRLGFVLYNLDADEKIIDNVIDSVYHYLSDKQPKELQANAFEFFKVVILYDADTVKAKIANMKKSDECKVNLQRINTLLENRD